MQCDSGKNLNGNRAVSPESAGYAPVVLFCYNRVENLIRTVAALRKNELAEETDLIIYSDGPKNAVDAEKVAAVREYIHLIRGFRSVEIHESECNKGLANSVIAGVTHVVNRYGKVIVLEDDLLTHPGFLRFMNEALVFYEKEERVAGIHGWRPLNDFDFPVPDTFFTNEVGCWGWATWKRAWSFFEPDGEKLLKQFTSAGQIEKFNVFNSYPFYELLQKQVAGEVDSWAIRWYASVFLNGKLGLQPGKNMIKNIGYSTGTHGVDGHHIPEDLLAERRPAVEKIDLKPAWDILKAVYVPGYEKYGLRCESNSDRIVRVLKKIIRFVLPYGFVLFIQDIRREQ